MKTRTKLIVIGATSVALAAAGGGIAIAGGGGDDAEAPITGAAFDRASAVALDHLGGDAKVTDTEVGDEESRYEVEVTRAGGGEVDVQLDGDFEVVGSEAETAGERDDD